MCYNGASITSGRPRWEREDSVKSNPNDMAGGHGSQGRDPREWRGRNVAGPPELPEMEKEEKKPATATRGLFANLSNDGDRKREGYRGPGNADRKSAVVWVWHWFSLVLRF